MSFAIAGLPRGYRYPQTRVLSSFAGGINNRDAAVPSELESNEVIDAWNVTFDERGGASSRLGYVKYNTPVYGTDLVQNIFWSGVLATPLVYAGRKIYKGTSNTVVHTFSTADLVTFAELNAAVIANHPVDGLFTSTDGTTWNPVSNGLGVVTVTIASPGVFTLANHGLQNGDSVYLTTTGALPTGLTVNTVYFVVAASTSTFELAATTGGTPITTTGSQSGTHHVAKGVVAPVGTCVAVWQNKVWVGMPNGSVVWSNAGTATVWTGTDFNNVWEKDGLPIVALHGQIGEDFPGNPGLLAYKTDSCYRVNDSSTGAYTTLDYTYGAANALCVVGVGASVYSLNRHGVFLAPSGASAGLGNTSDKLARLWDGSEINLSEQALWRAGRYKNRALFSLTRASSTANDLALEFHTEQGWFAAGSNAMSAYATASGTTDVTLGGSPTVAGQAYQLNSGGTDDGAAITGYLQTLWMDLLGGYKASILHVRVRGRGTGQVQIRKDYHETGDVQPISMAETTAITYDSGLTYDSGALYYVPSDEPTAVLYSVGAARQLSLLFSFTATTTVNAPQVLNAGASPQVGAFAVFLIEAMYVRLGIN